MHGAPRAVRPSPDGPRGILTAREREVAALVARGLGNREIAAALAISARTAERHVENIRAKLGVNSRVQIAVWANAQRPAGPSV
jgi:non-specific serine/threonine protein kinase